jgi:hypothetical protein
VCRDLSAGCPDHHSSADDQDPARWIASDYQSRTSQLGVHCAIDARQMFA